jgi:hypothetical protein
MEFVARTVYAVLGREAKKNNAERGTLNDEPKAVSFSVHRSAFRAQRLFKP